MALTITKKLIPTSRYNWKSHTTMKPVGICVHNTANDASALNEISYMTRVDVKVSYHYAVDDIHAVQALPENRTGWHAGDNLGPGNMKHIGIEICYSESGGDRFIKSEQNAVLLIVDILKRYGWGIDKVKKHQDFSGKYCPHRTLDMGWQRFLNMISKELAGNSWREDAKALPEGKRIYESIKEVGLVKIDSGEIVKTYPKGTELEFAVQYGDWYITPYSFDRNIKNGFLVSEMKLKTKPLPEDPVVPSVEDTLRKQVADLEEENRVLKGDLAASISLTNDKNEEIKGLKADVDEWKGDYDDLQKKYDVVYVDKNKYENLYTEAVRELNDPGRVKGIKTAKLVAELLNRMLEFFKKNKSKSKGA